MFQIHFVETARLLLLGNGSTKKDISQKLWDQLRYPPGWCADFLKKLRQNFWLVVKKQSREVVGYVRSSEGASAFDTGGVVQEICFFYFIYPQWSQDGLGGEAVRALNKAVSKNSLPGSFLISTGLKDPDAPKIHDI